MKILVINPNTTAEMTKQVEAVLNAVKRQGTVLEVINPKRGPTAVSSSCDELVAGCEVLEILRQTKQEDYDAVVIACYSEPGIVAARELCDIPVVGIAEAAMHVACMLGSKFTVLTTSKARVPAKEAYVHQKGLQDRLASVRALGVGVVEASHDPERAKEAVCRVAANAIEQDGAQVIILGCAGMAGYARELGEKLGVPILDPSTVALKVAELLVDLQLKPSRVGLTERSPHSGCS